MKKAFQSSNDQIDPVHYLNTVFILIVLYLHHTNYTYDFFRNSVFYYLLQKIAVGGFFITSGAKLSLSNQQTSAGEFFKKRFVRIYLLYVIALLLSAVTAFPFHHNGQFPSMANMLVHALCLQTILTGHFGPIFRTIWFVSVLFACYIQFLWLRKYLDDVRRLVVYAFILFLALSGSHYTSLKLGWPILTKDLPLYLMLFASGMALSRIDIHRHMRVFSIGIFMATGLLLTLLYTSVTATTPSELAIYSILVITNVLSFFHMVISSLSKISPPGPYYPIVVFISKASFCTFLFHRIIWTLMAQLYPEHTLPQWAYIFFLGTPIIIVTSYFIQKTYNELSSDYFR